MFDRCYTHLARRVNKLRRSGVFAVVSGVVLGTQLFGFFLSGAENVAADDVIAEYEVQTGGALVTLPVDIKGERYPFSLGADCTFWMFDESLRVCLQPIDSRVEAAFDGRKLFLVPEVSVGPLSAAAGARAICVPIHDEMAFNGVNVYGVIGLGFLRDKIFTIDFDRGKVTFLRRSGQDRGQRFKIDFIDEDAGPQTVLTVELPTGPERFRLCTSAAGFSAGSIAHATFARLLKEGHLSLVSEVGKKYVGISVGRTRSARLASFALAGFRHEKLLFDDSAISSLSLGYLSRYIVTFDFPNRAVYLKPGRNYDRIDREYNAGLTIWRERDPIRGGADAVVCNVVPGSPGAAAGIKLLDEIASVDGASTASTALFEIMRRLATPGRHEVVFVRDGKQMRAALVIDDDLGPPPAGTEAADSNSSGVSTHRPHDRPIKAR